MLFRLEFVLYIIEFLNEFQEENSYVLELVTTLLKIPKKRTKKHGLRGVYKANICISHVAVNGAGVSIHE